MYISAYDLREDIKDFDTSKNFYFWKRMLQKLFDLSEQSIYEWATRLREEIFTDRPEHPILDHPIHAIRHLFVARDLLKNGTFKYYPFMNEIIEQMIELGDFDDVNYHYDAAKQMITHELKKHNVELPEINKDNLVTRKEWHKLLAEEMLSQYIPFWKAFFREVLSVREEYARYWLLKHQMKLEGGSLLAYQDGPAYDVIDLTIPDELVYRLDIDWFAFRDKIFKIIDDDGNCRTSNYDFPKIKNCLTDFFSQYDTQINRPWAIAMADEPYLTTKHCAPFVLRFMANLLGEALGWSKEQTLEKATSSFQELHVESQQFERQIHLEIFYQNAGPSCTESILLEEIFGSELQRSTKSHELYCLIEKAIADGSRERGRPVYESDYDFVKVGEKIRSLIRQYKEDC